MTCVCCAHSVGTSADIESKCQRKFNQSWQFFKQYPSPNQNLKQIADDDLGYARKTWREGNAASEEYVYLTHTRRSLMAEGRSRLLVHSRIINSTLKVLAVDVQTGEDDTEIRSVAARWRRRHGGENQMRSQRTGNGLHPPGGSDNSSLLRNNKKNIGSFEIKDMGFFQAGK